MCVSVTLKPFVDEEEVKVVSLNPLVVLLPYSDWVWSTWIPCGFSTLKYLVSLCFSCSGLSFSVCAIMCIFISIFLPGYVDEKPVVAGNDPNRWNNIKYRRHKTIEPDLEDRKPQSNRWM